MSWLHRSAVLLAVSTILLLVLGALVTSTGSGLAVPTWPSTFGGVSLANAGIQQAHRLVAALVGLLTLAVVIGIWRLDRRPWMRGLSVAALALLVAQAVYGGIGVVNALPSYFSIFHAVLAQLFFAFTVSMAVFTSPSWMARDANAPRAVDRRLSGYAIGATLAIFLQVVIGATMRHSFMPNGHPASFAIPDYPLAFGRILPLDRLASWAVGLDFAHRLAALAMAALVCLIAARVFTKHVGDDRLVWPAALLALVLVAQIALGGLTVLSGGHPAISTTHAGVGALALAAALALSLWSVRPTDGLAPARAGAAAEGRPE